MRVIFYTPPNSQGHGLGPSESNSSKKVSMRAQICWLTQVQFLAPSASEDNKISLLELADEESIPSNPTQDPALAAVIQAMKNFAVNPVFNRELSNLATTAIRNIVEKRASTPIKFFSPGKTVVISPSPVSASKPSVARKLNFD
jgi:hypothetical protein